jgi:AcrR family transcriptional regulator
MVNSYTDLVPTPDRTSLDAIVRAASDLLESDGLPGVTMQAVASRVGVRAPSLYKRVENRDRLIQLVAEATLADLTARLDGLSSVAALADGLRAFSKERPAAFRLVMTPGTGTPVASGAYRAASERILQLAGELAGEEHTLEAARTVTAWATGFIIMELNGGFNLGGDVTRAWEYGVATLVEAITAARPA